VVRISRTHVITDQKEGPEPVPANGRVVTTVGRLVFNDILPTEMPLLQLLALAEGIGARDRGLSCQLGRSATIDLLDNIKAIGFAAARWRGCPSVSTTCASRSQAQDHRRRAEARSIASRRTFSQGA
jgi:hypothetical protein